MANILYQAVLALNNIPQGEKPPALNFTWKGKANGGQGYIIDHYHYRFDNDEGGIQDRLKFGSMLENHFIPKA